MFAVTSITSFVMRFLEQNVLERITHIRIFMIVPRVDNITVQAWKCHIYLPETSGRLRLCLSKRTAVFFLLFTRSFLKPLCYQQSFSFPSFLPSLGYLLFHSKCHIFTIISFFQYFHLLPLQSSFYQSFHISKFPCITIEPFTLLCHCTSARVISGVVASATLCLNCYLVAASAYSGEHGGALRHFREYVSYYLCLCVCLSLSIRLLDAP